ncbi:O-acetyl-L-homoserine sulfhydrylase [Austwickia sp. TVS 96-490-7B]|uniref:bifunctional o-acetylhomoserine/o-acetylserine sulfhydrylase n=1 Tax=Austwickia sp. TVS 96-490-7B TaxID=2830843 RepID=UPI001C5A4B19|nr:bifunctional o-acetylhomoserine/o-acetylserine sulfhydrylase [Austwickia sp. TVS 96-490-7B]MBW3086166.1 O-acetyl-L-homoserine sulfhydrylase [Austwickia sp. TVS 96-490-7B]
MSDWAFETRQIHAGQTPDPSTGARALPIYQTTSYVFDDAQTAAARFALTDLGPIYTRLGNPTTEVVENRLASLEGGVGALLLASGMAATTYAILNVAQAGDHVVASAALYGGTYNLLKYTLPRLGIETTFVADPADQAQWRAAVQPNTKLLLGESISNPDQQILDIAAVAAIAHEAGVPLFVDNTVATPYLIRPLEHGADVVIHSATKYLGGHGTAIVGALVDGGTFDYGREPGKFPQFTTPQESYHGLVYARDLGADSAFGVNLSFILKARVDLLRDTGAAVSPFNAFLLAQGVETLSLRMERHVANARAVAEFLAAHPQVESVNYASLPGNRDHERAQQYCPKGSGAVFSFEIAGGLEAGKAFVDALELHSHVANIGDVRSLVIHPASTTHSQGSDADRAGAGVTPGLIRLAVGIEHIEDILADLRKGFAAAASL